MEALLLREALTRFLGWLEGKAPIVFIAHNCQFSVFWYSLRESDMMIDFVPKILGFCDSAILLKDACPEKRSCSLIALAKGVLQVENFGAHNATDDVNILKICCLQRY